MAEGVFDNIKPTSFEMVFMPGAQMDSDAMEDFLTENQCPDGFRKDTLFGVLADFTVIWDSKGIACCQKCEGSNVFGSIHVLEVAFITQKLKTMAEVEMERGCEVKDQDGDLQDCFCWVVDEDFQKQEPVAEDLQSMVEYLTDLDKDTFGKLSNDDLDKYIEELKAKK